MKGTCKLKNNIVYRCLNEASPTREQAVRALWLIVLGALAFRVFLAAMLPLVTDETYAIAVAREYSISFFDHPPVSFWLPEIMGDLSGLTTPFIYRLPFLLAGSATTIVMFFIGREVSGYRAAVWTALLYSTAPFFTLSGGMFVVPDGPLYLASSLSVYAVLRLRTGAQKQSIWLWIGAGTALAFALGSKYHAAWIPVALLLFMGIDKRARRWFLSLGPWLGALIGLVGLVPVLWWNATHDWASFAFHESRAGGGLNLPNFLRMALVQSLMLLPSTLIVALTSLRFSLKGPRLFLALVALGPIVIFNVIYLTGTAPFAHWTMPGWIFLLPLAGAWLADRNPLKNRRFLAWTTGLTVMVWSVLLGLALQSATGILTRPFYDKPPKWDNTTALFDLGGLGAALEGRGLIGDSDFLMAETWIDAGQIDVALDGKIPMRVFNAKASHHFSYLSDALVTGRGLMVKVVRARDAAKREMALLAKARTLDPNAKPLQPVLLKRGSQDYVAVILVQFSLR